MRAVRGPGQGDGRRRARAQVRPPGHRVALHCRHCLQASGQPILDSQTRVAARPAPPRRAFSALARGDFRLYVIGATVAMMADNIEHVISYWVLYQHFHSAALAGFAVISHWVPWLLFGAYGGALADRFDNRRLIQLGMLMFASVSLCWSVMFYTGAVHLWMAMSLLVIHGLAGVVWMPSAQVLIHQIVGSEELASAVRINATGRYLGFLLGPAVGAGLMLALGPVHGLRANALFYAPLFLWAMRAAPRDAQRPRAAVTGFKDVLAAFRVVIAHPVLSAATLLIGGASCFVGNAYQAQMPGFARDLGLGRADFAYSMLLGADAAGGLAGGVVLESRGLLRPHVRTAFVLAMIWCAALIGFAATAHYALALALLFVAGFTELAFYSMAQALVQLHAPQAMRGRVIGVFSMSALGLRAFSGINVGLAGARLGIHTSLGLSAGALLAFCAALLVLPRRALRV
jgi:MFS family permease